MSAADLGLAEAASAIAAGRLSSEDLVAACLERIAEREPQIHAWAYLDRDQALATARRADEQRATGLPLGPLHGVPVGVKDIIDTADMPTEYGSPLYAGNKPRADGAVVTALRAAGAVILGKTVTTEFATYTPGPTANPHDPTRTPGGSSSGSAAAVAAAMVPAAVGTQTAGSVIRPASFCGIVGFKPTFGVVPRHGVLRQSRPLDTIGTLARSVDDAALLAEAIAAYDPRDPDSRVFPAARLSAVARAEPPVAPSLAFVRQPAWSQGDEAMHQGFAELIDALGDAVDEVALPEPFDNAITWHRLVMLADFAKSFATDYAERREGLSDMLCGLIEEGQGVLAVDYNRALDWREVLNAGLDEIFERYDAIVTPAAPGEAPAGLSTTGNPVFNALWTYCGTPAVTVPLLQGENGLPIGVQLIAARGDDARLLRTANWLRRTAAGGA